MDKQRTAAEVLDELKKRGVSHATGSVVETTLKRRTGKTLERLRDQGQWVYRRKNRL